MCCQMYVLSKKGFYFHIFSRMRDHKNPRQNRKTLCGLKVQSHLFVYIRRPPSRATIGLFSANNRLSQSRDANLISCHVILFVSSVLLFYKTIIIFIIIIPEQNPNFGLARMISPVAQRPERWPSRSLSPRARSVENLK